MRRRAYTAHRTIRCAFCGAVVHVDYEACGVFHALPACPDFLRDGQDALDFLRRNRVRAES